MPLSPLVMGWSIALCCHSRTTTTALRPVCSCLHKYPQYIGAGMYDRLARIFVQEAMAENEETTASQDGDIEPG
ncbi:hypothetical protein H6F86_20410 [Phormidium sp. FACHB-592]|uniref:Secreted protein n=1 Tax=Stenomitos frigidus AS-A4 TaxID=2933935 RepID=A0ABV0KGT1_9CYAN|nr:hypothetical protein [Phormidium sp. FACHB-592]MBD2076195.1 hypothetical protein [Phormidium sp. FACHB-592]